METNCAVTAKAKGTFSRFPLVSDLQTLEANQ